MDVKIKALVVLFPFIVGGYVGFSLLQPALEEVKTKDAAVSEKNTENEDLKNKLQGSKTVSQQEKQLRDDIERLRDSVPKAPDTDLLAIDLEKMCKKAGMNMVALTAPKAENKEKSKSAEDATQSKKDKLKNMLKGGGAGVPAEGAMSAVGGAQPEGAAELEQSQKSLTVTGDYEGLRKLVHELETYQRVVHIDNLSLHWPRKESDKKIKIDDSLPAEGEETGDPRLLFITMTLTTYFLP
jgi:hypothetical protein